MSPAHCANPVAPSILELDLLDSLNGDVKEKSSWVLCWEQPVLDALLSPLLPIPKLQIAWLGILLCWGSFGGGRMVEVPCLQAACP